MRRLSRHDYGTPGSFQRLHEAALAVAEADSEDDVAYHRACCRLRAAALAYAAARPNGGTAQPVEPVAPVVG